jgi:hypothetical protein
LCMGCCAPLALLLAQLPSSHNYVVCCALRTQLSALPTCLVCCSNLCRVLAPWLPPPPHLAAPSAGLLLLSPAAALTSSPQMLCPAASLGLQDAAVLAAAVAAAVPKNSASSSVLVTSGGDAAGSGSGSGSEELHRHVEQALKHFDRMRQPEVSVMALSSRSRCMLVGLVLYQASALICWSSSKQCSRLLARPVHSESRAAFQTSTSLPGSNTAASLLCAACRLQHCSACRHSFRTYVTRSHQQRQQHSLPSPLQASPGLLAFLERPKRAWRCSGGALLLCCRWSLLC